MCHFALSFELQKVSQKEIFFLNLAAFSRRIRQERRHGREEDFRFYSDGITRVRNFIHTERYNMIGAVRDAAKAAYAAACALNKIATPLRYSPQALEELAAARIPASFSSRLNNLKTQNPEAFFYWLKTSELMQ